MRAPLLAAVAFGLFALLPIVAPGPVGLGRTLLAALLSGAAAALIVASRPRGASLIVDFAAETIETTSGTVALAQARRFRLATSDDARDEIPRSRYRVELELEDGARHPLLERADPARVLRDLRATLTHWRLPVVPGWGLPREAAPWKANAVPLPPAAPCSATARAHGGELGAGLCVLGGFIMVATTLVVMHVSRSGRGEATSLLSSSLTTLTLGLLLGIGLWLVTDRVTATADGESLSIARRALFTTWQRQTLVLAELRGVWAIGVVPGEPLHLLFDLGSDVTAVRFAGAQAERVAATLRGDGAARASLDPERPGRAAPLE